MKSPVSKSAKVSEYKKVLLKLLSVSVQAAATMTAQLVTIIMTVTATVTNACGEKVASSSFIDVASVTLYSNLFMLTLVFSILRCSVLKLWVPILKKKKIIIINPLKFLQRHVTWSFDLYLFL